MPHLRREVLIPVPPPTRLSRVVDHSVDIATGLLLAGLSLFWLAITFQAY